MKRTLPTTALLFLMFLVLGLGVGKVARAQFAYTAVTASANMGNPGGLNAELDDAVAGWIILQGPNQATNQWTAQTVLPFRFMFYNRRVTHFRVTSNGVLSFLSTVGAAPGNNTAIPSATLPDSSIAAFWDAFTTAPPMGANDLILTKTFGSAPNRQFWIRWMSCERSTANDAVGVTKAIVLEETTNRIYIVDMYNTNVALTSSVGIQATSTDGLSFGSNIPGTVNLTNAVANNSYYTFTPNLVGDYTVGGTSPDFASPVAAATALNTCGVGGAVRMNIRNNTYTGKVVLNAITGTNATNSVTFRSESGNKTDVTITAPSDAAAGSNYAVLINNADYVTFRDLTITRTGTNAYASLVDIAGNATYLRFANCILTGVGSTGTATDRVGVNNTSAASNNIAIDSCQISTVAIGIYFNLGAASAGIAVRNNNINIPSGGLGWGVYTTLCSAVSVQDNIVSCSNSNPALRITNCDGAAVVMRNQVTNAAGPAAWYTDCDGTVGTPQQFVNNVLISTPGANATAASLVASACTYVNFDYNTFYTTNGNTNGAAITLDGAVAGTANCNLRNNIFANFGTGYAIEEINQGRSYIGLMRNNLTYAAGSNFFLWNGTAGNAGATFEGLTAFADAGNVYDTDPLFVNASLQNFRLQASSPAINAGFNVGVTEDYDRNPRPINVGDAGYDIGAYEFICTPALAAGTYTIGATGTYTTMAQARDALLCGITGPVRFQIQAGTYTVADLVMPYVPYTSATDTILFEALSGPGTVFLTRDAAVSQSVLNFVDAQYMTFRNLSIDVTGSSANHNNIRLNTGTQFIRFDGCDFNNSYTGAFAAASYAAINSALGTVNDITVNNCKFNGTTSAINASSLTGLTFSNNYVSTTRGLVFSSCSNITLAGNEIYRLGALTTYEGIVATTCSQLIIRGNKISITGGIANNAIGINGLGDSGNAIINNFIVFEANAAGSGISLTNSSNVNIHYNSIRLTSSTTSASCFRFATTALSNSVDLMGNIAYNDNGYIIVVPASAIGMLTTTSDRNLYFRQTGTVYGFWNGTDQTFANWKTSSARDFNTISVDPRFVSTTDLHVQYNSPAIKALPVLLSSSTVDVDNHTRALPNDIGADYYWCNTAGTPIPTGTYTLGTSMTYQNFNHAALSLERCGINGVVIFSVQPGTYTEQVNFVDYYRQNSTDSVRFVGTGGPTISLTSTGTIGPTMVNIGDAKRLTFQNITFTRPGGLLYGRMVELGNNADRINFNNCTFNSTRTAYSTGLESAIIYSGNTNIQSFNINNCNFTNGTNAIAIIAPTVTQLGITNNVFSNQYHKAITLTAAPNSRIENNFINSGPLAAMGIEIYQATGKSYILRNRIDMNLSGPSTYCVGISINTLTASSGNEALVANNQIFTRGTTTFLTRGIETAFSSYVRFAHNSVSINTGNASSTAFEIQANCTNLEIFNNIFACFNGCRAVIVDLSSAVGSNQMNYNNLFTTGSPFALWGMSSATTFALWQSASGRDANGVGTNPLYTSNTTDLTPTGASPALNRATVVSYVSIDFVGTARSTDVTCPKRDIGAFEIGCAFPLSGSYVVGPTGNFLTPALAIAALQDCGVGGSVTLNIQNGTYAGFEVPDLCGASASSMVRMKSQSGNKADVKIANASSASSVNNYTVSINGARYFSLSDVTIERTGSLQYASVISLSGTPNNVDFSGDSIVCHHTNPTAADQDAIYWTGVTNSQNMAFINSSINGGWRGFHMSTAATQHDSYIFNGCTFRNQIDHGIAIVNGVPSTPRLDNLTVYGCTFTTNASTTYTAIRHQSATLNFDISNNIIHIASSVANANVGIRLTGDPAVTSGTKRLINNVVTMTGTHATAFGIGITNCGGVDILHNSVRTESNCMPISLIHSNALVNAGTLVNNVFYTTGNSVAASYNANALARFAVATNNVYFTLTNAMLISYNSTNYPNINAYLNAQSIETNSLQVDPLFSSATNLSLAFGSPVARAGYSVGISDDILGLPRNGSHPSAGAYERNCPASPLIGNYTIGSSGDFATLLEAFDHLHRCGISGNVGFGVQNGTYSDQLVMGTYPGMDTRNVEFFGISGNPADVVVRTASSATFDNNNFALGIHGTRGVSFKDMMFLRTGTNAFGNVVQIRGGAKDIIFYRDSLRTTGSSGATTALLIPDQFQQNIEIDNCGIFSTGNGVFATGNAIPSFDNNLVISNNRFKAYNYAVALEYFRSATVSGNRVYNQIDSYGFNIANTTGGTLLIRNNLIFTRNIPLRIILAYPTAGAVENNVAANRNAAVNVLEIKGVANIDFTHNTLVSNVGAGIPFFIQDEASNANMKIRNNIFANLGGMAALRTEVGVNTEISDLNHNLYYSPNSGNNIIEFGTSNYLPANFLQFVSDFGYEGNGKFGNPQFTNAAGDDFSLLLASPAIRMGDGGPGVPTDILGVSRSALYPTSGAYEATCSGGPLSGTYSLGASGTYKSFLESTNALRLCGIGGPVTFNVETGDYPEQVEVYGYDIAGQSTIRPVVYRSATGNPANVRVQWPSSTFPTNNYTLVLISATAFTFRDMTIQRTSGGSFGDVVQVVAGSHNTSFANDSIRAEASGATLVSYGGSNVPRVDSCSFFGGNRGLSLAGLSGHLRVRYNRFYNQTGTVLDIGGVSGNQDIIGNSMGITSGPSSGISIVGGPSNEIRIQRNIIQNFNNVGIYLSGMLPPVGDSIIIDNNVLYDQANATAHTGIQLDPVNRVYVCHNTVRIRGTNAGNIGLSVPSMISGNSIRLYNNIFSMEGSGLALSMPNGVAIAFHLINLAHNVFYKGVNANVVRWDGTLRATVTAWRTAVPTLPTQYEGFPNWVNAPTDLRLQPCSPYINVGHTTGGYLPAVDITNASRAYPAMPTLGAYHPTYCGTAGMAGTHTVGAGQWFDTPASTICGLNTCAVADPVRFSILPGNYLGVMEFTTISGTSPADTVLYTSSTGNKAHVMIGTTSSAVVTQNYVVSMNGTDYVTFKNLTLKRSGNQVFARVVALQGGIDHVAFVNDSIVVESATANSSSHCFDVLSTGGKIYIDSCALNGGYIGINSTGDMPTRHYRFNKFANQSESAIEFAQASGRSVILGNEMVPVGTGTKNGIKPSNIAAGAGARIIGNKLRYRLVGIQLSTMSNTTDSVVVANNAIAEYNPDNTTSNHGILVLSSPNAVVRIQHNTIRVNNTFGSGASTGLYLLSPSAGGGQYYIENNIIWTSANAVCFRTTDANASALVNTSRFNNNVYHTAYVAPYIWSGNNYTSLSAFVTASGSNADSQFGNPLFVSAPDNLALQSCSPAARTGRPMPWIPQDIISVNRSASFPSCGAYEFGCAPLAGTYTLGAGPYPTFASAFCALQSCGVSGPVRFNVNSGVYPEQVTLGYVPGTSATDTVLFVSQTGNAVDVELQHPSAIVFTDNYALRITGASHVTFRAMTIRRTGMQAAGTTVAIEPTRVLNKLSFARMRFITDNNVASNSFGVIAFPTVVGNAINDIRVDSSRIEGCLTGISFSTHVYNPSISHNTLANTTNGGIVIASSQAGSRFKIHGNVFEATGNSPATAIDVNNVASGSGGVISSNQVRMSLSGIYVANAILPTDSIVIVNNTVAEYLPAGVTRGIFLSTNNTGNLFVYHNTVAINSSNASSSAIQIQLAAGGATMKVLNNIFQMSNLGRTVTVDATSTTKLAAFDHNLMYNSSANPALNINWSGTNYTTLAAFRTVVPSFMVNSVAGNSGLVAPPTDLSLGAGSMGARFGTPLPQFNTDITGTSRSATAPSIGAYEYVCSGGPLAGDYLVGPAQTYATPQQALDALYNCGMNAPVRMRLTPTTHVGTLNFGPIYGCNNTDTLVFEAQTGVRSSITLESASSANALLDYTVVVEGTQHLTLRNLTIKRTGFNTYASCVLVRTLGTHFNMFGDSLWSQNISSGIASVAGLSIPNAANSHLLIDGNYFRLGRTGIYSNATSAASLTLRNNTVQEVFNTSNGINVLNLNTDSLTIVNNTLGVIAQNVYVNAGIRIQSCNLKGKIEANTAYYNQYGLSIVNSSFSGARSLTLHKNIIVQNPSGPSVSDGIEITNVDGNLNVYYNTVFTRVVNTNTYGLYVNNTSAGGLGFNIRNNIFASDGFGKPVVVNANATSRINSFTHNLIDHTTVASTLIDWAGVTHNTVASFLAANPTRVANVEGDPQFVAMPTNMNITLCSPAYRNATPLAGYTEDYLGETRDATLPSMGAFERIPCYAPLAGTYTVGATGTYPTVTDAACALSACGISAPVMMNIQTGVYVEKPIFNTIPGVSATDTVLVQAQSGNRADVVIESPSTVDGIKDYTLMFNSVSYLTLRQLTIARTDFQPSSNLVRLLGNNQYLRLDGDSLRVDGSNGELILSDGTAVSRFIYITNSKFQNGYSPIYSGTNHPLNQLYLTDNVFEQFSGAACDFYGCDSLYFHRNTFTTNRAGASGLAIYNHAGLMEITQNRITTRREAIMLDNSSGTAPNPIQVYNNVLQTVNGAAANVPTLKVTGGSYINIENNTIAANGSLALQGAQLAGSVSDLTLRNNIISAWSAGSVAMVVPSPAHTGIVDLDHNLYYANGNAVLVSYAGTNYANLSDFQSAVPAFNIHSQEGDPLFVGLPADASIASTASPAIKAGGVITAFSTDIQDTPRDVSRPTIGAYEYACPALAGTYEIGTTGDFLSFTAAVLELKACGISAAVRMEVQVGMYNESISIAPISGANAADTVLFVSQSPNPTDVLLHKASSGTGEANYVVELDNADYITFEGMTLNRTGFLSNSRVVHIVGDAQHNRFVRDSIVSDNTYQELVYIEGTGSCVDLVFDDNAFQNGFNGLKSDKADSLMNLVVNNNRFYNQTSSLAINLTKLDGIRITRNVITNGYAGIYLFGIEKDVQITQNKIVADKLGLYMGNVFGTAGDYVQVVNNSLTVLSGTDPDEYGLAVQGGRYMDILHNSVYVSNSNAAAPAVFLEGTLVNNSVNFVNNAVQADNNATAIHVVGSAMSGMNTMNHNLYFSSNGIGEWGGTPAANLAAWQPLTGFDGQSLETNPAFTSATDHKPVLGSPLAGAGTPVGILVDINDSSRSATAPTIGAYESECGNMSVDVQSTTPVLCSGGSDGTITVSVTGGVGPYSYSLDNFATSQGSNIFVGLPAGNYHIYVKDANNCTAQTATPAGIFQPPVLTCSTIVSHESCVNTADGSITIIAFGGTGSLQYSIDGGFTYSGASYYPNLAPGSYNVFVMDANGCFNSVVAIINAASANANLSLMALLEGPYLSGPQVMGDSLNKPAFQILTNLYNPSGLGDTTGYYGNVKMKAGFSVPAGAVDVVKIVIRTGTAANTAVDSTLAWLMSDGSIRDFRTAVNSYVSFCNTAPGFYYVVVQHRNHLAIMSNFTCEVTSGLPDAIYDLTNPANLYGGTDAAKVVGGKALMYAGNAYDDPVFDWGEINANDFFMVIIDTDFPSQPHYIATDVNLDGKLNAADFDVVSWNNDNLYRSYVPR